MIVYLLLALFPIILKSQEYVPLAVDDAHWFVAYNDHELPLPCENMWEYFVNGDTMVNDIEYKKVYRFYLESDTSEIPCTPPFHRTGEPELIGLIRDNIEGKKVHAILFEAVALSFCPLNEEFELYDFSLTQGDSINICLSSFIEGDTVMSSAMGTAFGIYSKHIQSSDYYYTSMYEGIGSDFGLFEPFFIPVKHTNTFNTWLYDYCRNDTCELLVNIKNYYYQDDYFKLFPNPTKERFELRFDAKKIVNVGIMIYDNIGRLVYKRKPERYEKGENSIKIDLIKYSPGIYNCVLQIDQNKTVTKKFIKL